MYTSVWVYISVCVYPTVVMSRLQENFSVTLIRTSVFLRRRLTLNLELADWLDQLAGELLGIHLPLHTQYWGYRCLVLVPGFHMRLESGDLRGTAITSPALGVCFR